MSETIGLRVLSADLKSGAETAILYFGAPTYVISILDSLSLLIASPSIFLIISTPSDFGLVISKIPRISTDGNLIFELTSSIAEIVFFGNFRSSKTLIPFVQLLKMLDKWNHILKK